ncbi:hypothetical protein SLE2022_113950 [Rubroshorea leprosula]
MFNSGLILPGVICGCCLYHPDDASSHSNFVCRPLSILFSVTPLSWTAWTMVLYLSFPVIIIDEVLKLFSRNSHGIRFDFRFWRPDTLPKKELHDK